MVSINTNLSSLIVQGNLTNSTNGLNKAVERLSTGYKINHAGDNAANYSIANKYEAKLSSYDVAADNITMGMDLLSVAQDTISTMQNHGARLQALITQARNGTYGAQSLNAMTQEAGAIISEIQRMYTNAEYNGINLFDNLLPDWVNKLNQDLTPDTNGFIAEIEKITPDVVVTSALGSANEISLEDAISSNAVIGIANADVLAQLATLVNDGMGCNGKTFILTKDIDLSDYQEDEGWTPIGTSSNPFKGIFDGQGHKITKLKIDRGTENQGLFGYAYTGSIIKNLGISDAKIRGGVHTGVILGRGTSGSKIINCFVTGNISGKSYTGGIVGQGNRIENCYANATVKGTQRIGGLAGQVSSNIINSSFKGNVVGTLEYVGGIVGITSGYIQNCYAVSDVKGTNYVGGIAGSLSSEINNSYAIGDVSGKLFTGGLVGIINKTSGTLNNDKLFFSGAANGTGKYGSLIGGIVNTSNGSDFATITISKAKVASNNDIDIIGGTYSSASGNPAVEYNMSEWLNNISEYKTPKTTIQVGIQGDESSQIGFVTGFNFDLNSILTDIRSDRAYSSITKFMSTLSEKATDLGAASNRLESALDSVLVNMENLTSSLSTVKDVDMAQESSQYIRMQILQQASATLLATANQSPSIALQLI